MRWLLCKLFGIHYWFYWRLNAHYRYCKYCHDWQHLVESVLDNTCEWKNIGEPNATKLEELLQKQLKKEES